MGYKRETLQTIFMDPDLILKAVANLEKENTEPKQRVLYDEVRQIVKFRLEQQEQETKETIVEGLESLLEVL